MDEIAQNTALKSRLMEQKLGGNNVMQPKGHVHPQVGTVVLYGVPIVSLVIENQERLCLAQISNTLLKQFSYNEIHNRRVALGITCVQCTPVQLEILRRAGAMPVSSRRCGMITRREAERLCKSFLGDNAPPRLPDDFAFSVHHECAWGCRGAFLPARYNSSRAKCIKCSYCGLFFSPNKFIFHSHRTSPNANYIQPDAANFNSWRRHMKLSGSPPDNIVYAWEDVKAMFNGGTRKRMLSGQQTPSSRNRHDSPSATLSPPTVSDAKLLKLESSPPPASTPYPPPPSTPLSLPQRVPPFPELSLPMSMMDYVWHGMDGLKPSFLSPYLPWLSPTKRAVLGYSSLLPSHELTTQHFGSLPQHHGKFFHQSAFQPVFPNSPLRQKKPGSLDLKVKEGSTKTLSGTPGERMFGNGGKCLRYDIDDSTDSCESGGKDDSEQKTGLQRVPESLLLNRPGLLRAFSRMSSVGSDPGLGFLSGGKDESPRISAENDKDDEDETVDIETTDDGPDQDVYPRSEGSGSSRTSSKTGLGIESGDVESRLSKNQERIWTIARFSMDDSSLRDSHSSSPKKPFMDDEPHVINLTTTTGCGSAPKIAGNN